MFHKMFLAATSACSLAVWSAMAASFQGLGDFPDGSFDSGATGVSADGRVVVGSGTTASGQQAFRWTPGAGLVSLGNLPNGSFKRSAACAVSADGAVIVGYGDPVGSGWDTLSGFRWTLADGMTDIGSLEGSTRSLAWGVSADGSVVVGDSGSQAFRWTRSGGIAGLGVLSGWASSGAAAVSADGSVVVGSNSTADGASEEAFRWTSADGMVGVGYLPGTMASFALAVSPEGSVVAGTCASATGQGPCFRWTQSTGMIKLGSLPGRITTHPSGVSANGSIIVGGSFSDPAHGDAFIWDAQSVLQTEYGLNLAAWKLQAAIGITPDGNVIVGHGINPSGQTEAFRVVLGLDPPRLAIARNGASVDLSWDSQYSDYVLESAPVLDGHWQPVSGVTGDTTGFSATRPVAASSQYFRLRK